MIKGRPLENILTLQAMQKNFGICFSKAAVHKVYVRHITVKNVHPDPETYLGLLQPNPGEEAPNHSISNKHRCGRTRLTLKTCSPGFAIPTLSTPTFQSQTSKARTHEECRTFSAWVRSHCTNPLKITRPMPCRRIQNRCEAETSFELHLKSKKQGPQNYSADVSCSVLFPRTPGQLCPSFPPPPKKKKSSNHIKQLVLVCFC